MLIVIDSRDQVVGQVLAETEEGVLRVLLRGKESVSISREKLDRSPRPLTLAEYGFRLEKVA